MEVIKTLLLQKKFIVTILGLVAAVTARHGFNLPVEESAAILLAFLTYVFAQGKADTGKEAALITAASPQGDQVNIQNVNPPPPADSRPTAPLEGKDETP